MIIVLGDKGTVTCIDAKTGKARWSGAFGRHRAKYYSSPTIAGDKLYAAREDGMLMIGTARAPFETLAEIDMGERIIASPVPINGRLLIRGDDHLFCVSKP